MLHKNVAKSKTIWVGLTEMGLGFFDLFGAAFECTFNGVQSVWVLILMGVLKLWLRMISKDKLVVKAPNTTDLSRVFGGEK